MVRRIIPDVIRDQKVVCLAGTASVREAAKLMQEHNVGAVLIMAADVLEGIVTVNDVTCRLVAAGRDPETTSVEAVMTPDPDTVGPETTAIEALRLMQDGGYRHLPVMDGDRVMGVLSRRDFFGVEKARLDDENALWERIG